MAIQRAASLNSTIAGAKQQAKPVARGRLLFVSYGDESLEEGVAYAIEHAKVMHEDIVMLLIEKKIGIVKKIEDVMAGVAFAEAGEHESAREIAALKSDNLPSDYRTIMDLTLRANKEGVQLTVERTERSLISAVKSFVKQHSRLNKVILSPTVTESELLTTRDLSRLVRTASLPVVTMTRKAVRESMQAGSPAEKTV